MKHGYLFLLLVLLLTMCGCGHSVLLETEVTGIGFYVPVGEGATLGMVIGNAKSTTATVRGGTTLETTTSASGGIFAGEGGVNKITTFKTNQQLNEGNFKEVMLSPEVPTEAKIILASNMVTAAKSPKVAQTVLQTKTTSIHTGEATATNGVIPIVQTPTGLDKVMDTIPQVVVPVIHDTTDIVNNTVNKAEDAISGTSATASKTFLDFFRPLKGIRWGLFSLIVIGGILVTIILIFLFGWIGSIIKAFINRKKPTSSAMGHTAVPPLKEDAQQDLPGFQYDEGIVPDRTEDIQRVDVMKKPGIWERLSIIFSVIKSLFSRIPPGVKKQLMEIIVGWMRTKAEQIKKQQQKKQ